MEKDLGNLRLLVSLWDEEGGSPWQPLYRGAKGCPAGRPAHVASARKLCPKGVVVELKREIVEGKEERSEKVMTSPSAHVWSIDHG
jgi:hypothetical protein